MYKTKFLLYSTKDHRMVCSDQRSSQQDHNFYELHEHAHCWDVAFGLKKILACTNRQGFWRRNDLSVSHFSSMLSMSPGLSFEVCFVQR